MKTSIIARRIFMSLLTVSLYGMPLAKAETAAEKAFETNLVNGMNDSVNQQLQMNKLCNEQPNSKVCLEREQASQRFMANGIVTLNDLLSSDFIRKLREEKALRKREELERINETCTKDPKQFICQVYLEKIRNEADDND